MSAAKAALAGPNCDADNRHAEVRPGDRGSLCRAVQGGREQRRATATGVTKDTIKVVVYGKSSTSSRTADLAFKPTISRRVKPARSKTCTTTSRRPSSTRSRLYGRKVELDFVYQTGTDEASQRADAVAVAAKKPFAVLGGGPVFSRAIAAKKIVVISAGTNNEMEAQQPYRESSATDLNIPMVALAELIKKSLNGHPARWAGSADLQKKQRVFGIQYSSGPGVDRHRPVQEAPDASRCEDRVSAGVRASGRLHASDRRGTAAGDHVHHEAQGRPA